MQKAHSNKRNLEWITNFALENWGKIPDKSKNRIFLSLKDQQSKRLHNIFVSLFDWHLLADRLRRIQIIWDEEVMEMRKVDQDTQILETQAVNEELRLLNIDLEH